MTEENFKPTGARWYDVCQHVGHDRDARYLGTVEDDGETRDVYVFYDRWLDEWSCCIRFGDEGQEYYSPGPIQHWKENHYGNAGELVLLYLAKKAR